jgi:hypothetical protein
LCGSGCEYTSVEVVGGGGAVVPFATVTVLEAVAVRPSVAVALTESVCDAFVRVVVSSWPAGSPLYWYGEAPSSHFDVPSTKNSILRTLAPEAVDVHVIAPLRVAPFAMLDETVNAGVVVGTDWTVAVAALVAETEPALLDAVTATRIVAPASPETSAYVVPVAPLIGAHVELQRCHW